MALRIYKRTTDKNLRNRDWRGASSELIEHRRHPLISSTRKKYGLKKLGLKF
jgi:hypothetical protein